MIHAYDKIYLLKAQTSFAVMLDFAVYDLKYELKNFYTRFLDSNISTLFENGDSSVLSGKSGVELALEVTNDFSKAESYHPAMDRSPEFWTGWSLAYFQWFCGLKFRKINDVIPIEEVCEMYNPYHEMDISQFCDHMFELYKSRKTISNLKSLRIKSGLSQTQLAQMTEIPVRTIQQYEQKQKNINAARAEYIIKIAKVLNCDAEDLLEVDE